MMLEERVALEIINAHGRLLDLPEISSLAEIRYDSERQLNLRIARAIIPMVLEEAAKVAERRHEQWRLPHPDDAQEGEVCCDVTACADIAAAIRAIGASHER